MAISFNSGANSFGFIEQFSQLQLKLNEKIASGKRINSAADDAAGLQIASRLTGQVNGLEQQANNARDEIGLNNIKGAQLSAISDGLQRANELAVRAGSPLADKRAIQNELNQITEQVNTLAGDALGNSSLVSGLDANDFATTQANLDTALTSVNDAAAQTGADINALNSRIDRFTLENVNVSEARSRIEDADFAKISSQQSQNDILLRSSILAKKNDESRKGLLFNQLV